MGMRCSKVQKYLTFLLFVGWVFLAAGCGRQEQVTLPTGTMLPESTSTVASEVESAPALKQPEAGAASIQAAPEPTEEGQGQVSPCAEGTCGSLMITQAGQPQQINVNEAGLMPRAQPSPLPDDLSENGRWVIDTGQPSPDGSLVAYTSVGYETGAPVFVQNLESGEWQNLIAAVNQRLGGASALPLDYWWDVIGWFPDSRRLMIGPSDLSFVAVVELTSSTAQIISFPGGGRGGRMFVNLAPDGESFLFTGDNGSEQTFNIYDLSTGQVTTLYTQPYEQGFVANPRFSPDGETIAYVNQSGAAEASAVSTGPQDTLNLLSIDGGAPKTLAEGSLWMAVPAWSPDGERLAFAMADADLPTAAASAIEAGDTDPAPVRGNVWTVTTGGAQEQITFVDGLARSPTWSMDGQTLAFVTHDGQVGLVNADEPGLIWQAAGPSEQAPELISAFFLP